MIVDTFKIWLKEGGGINLLKELHDGDIYEYEASSPIESSIVITHENQEYIGQITVRNNGFVDIEVISQKNEELVFYIHCMTNKEIRFESLMDNYFEFIEQTL